VAAAIALFPFYFAFSTSLKTTHSQFTYPPEWFPSEPTFENYRYVLTDMPFFRYLFNTLLVASTVSFFKVIFDAMAGYAFAKFQFYGKRFLFTLILSTLMIPFAVRIIPTLLIVRRLGIFDNPLALILPPLAYPMGILMMTQFMETLPSELADAARIDGCSEFRVFWHTVLPLSTPAVATLAIFTFLWQWTEFLLPLIMTYSPKSMVLTLAIANLRGQLLTNWGAVMAATVLAMIPILVLFLLFQRYFIEGITIGAVKG
jgi:ABC-type glycerol-3-phosphate transport system permease component